MTVPIYALTDTWTVGATTYTGIGINVTDTSSAAASLLLDLQVGGTSKFNVRKDGQSTCVNQVITTGTITTSTPAISATQTWNAGGVTFTGASIGITDTASASGSYYFSITRNGSQWFNVQKGTIAAYTNYPYLSSGTNAYRGAVFLVESGVGIGRLNATSAFTMIGADITNGTTGTVCVASNNGSGVKGKIGFTATDPFQNEPDIFLSRPAAGIFGLNTSTTVGGSMASTKGGSNLTVTGTTNNLALDASQFQRLTGASTPVLTGVAPPSGGAHVDGNIRYLFCLGATSIVLNHNDSNSSAANRMYMSTGANITLAQNQSVRLTYDATDNGSGAAGWRCTSAT